MAAHECLYAACMLLLVTFSAQGHDMMLRVVNRFPVPTHADRFNVRHIRILLATPEADALHQHRIADTRHICALVPIGLRKWDAVIQVIFERVRYEIGSKVFAHASA